jgi:hypothetical protein
MTILQPSQVLTTETPLGQLLHLFDFILVYNNAI